MAWAIFCEVGSNSSPTRAYEGQALYKDINYAHGIRVRHVVIKRFWEEKTLRTIFALNEPFHLAHLPDTRQIIVALQNCVLTLSGP
jgi:hypothetical protein